MEIVQQNISDDSPGLKLFFLWKARLSLTFQNDLNNH
jgi:hypothetical protein